MEEKAVEEKPLPQEQEIFHETYIRFDVVDALKLLFGRSLKIRTKMIFPANEMNEAKLTCCNVVTEITTVPTTSHFDRSNLPPFGYVAKEEKQPVTDKVE